MGIIKPPAPSICPCLERAALKQLSDCLLLRTSGFILVLPATRCLSQLSTPTCAFADIKFTSEDNPQFRVLTEEVVRKQVRKGQAAPYLSVAFVFVSSGLDLPLLDVFRYLTFPLLARRLLRLLRFL